MTPCPLIIWDKLSFWSVNPNRPRARFERALGSKARPQRPPRNLPGPGPRLRTHPEIRPGPPGLEPPRSPLPQRPTRRRSRSHPPSPRKTSPPPLCLAIEELAKKAADPFRQVQLAMQAADLKVRLGRTDQALRDFETMLGKLRPDSWLHREVRRKIEEVFLRNDDQPGLVTYYERWTKKEPEDIEALVRLGRTLASMGRAAEALPWYEKAIKLAPTRRDLRLALISQLASDQKFAEAAAQYEALDQAEPNNPDTLRDWGPLLLRDTAKPAPERKAAAAAIWKKMLIAKAQRPGQHRSGRRPVAPGRIDRRCTGPLQKGCRTGSGQSSISRIYR